MRGAAPVKVARDNCLAERRRELGFGTAGGTTALDAAILADAFVNAACRIMTELLAQTRRRATWSRLTEIKYVLSSPSGSKPIHFLDLVDFGSAWSLDLHNVPRVLADQRARDRRSY